MNIKSFTKKAVVVALLAGVAVGANALVPDSITNLGSITVGAPTSFNQQVAASGIFYDVFTFTLPSNGGSGYSLQTLDVAPLFVMNFTSVALISNPDGILSNSDDVPVQSAFFVGSNKNMSLNYPQTLAPGSYYLAVMGLATGLGPILPAQFGGPLPAALYNGSVSVIAAPAAAAVPEPESYAMLLAGLGLMGAIIRRRSRGAS